MSLSRTPLTAVPVNRTAREQNVLPSTTLVAYHGVRGSEFFDTCGEILTFQSSRDARSPSQPEHCIRSQNATCKALSATDPQKNITYRNCIGGNRPESPRTSHIS